MVFSITCNKRQKNIKICRQLFISSSTLKEVVFISFLTLPIRILKTVAATPSKSQDFLGKHSLYLTGLHPVFMVGVGLPHYITLGI